MTSVDLRLSIVKWLQARSLTEMTTWLRTGISGIEEDGLEPHAAFSPGKYIIGAKPESDWREDVLFIAQKLPAAQRAQFDEAVVNSLEMCRGIRHSPSAPAHHSQGEEGVALALLWIARNGESHAVGRILHALCRDRFPHSQEVFDAALWTWRLLTPTIGGASFAEWALTDLARMERRYLPSLFIGLPDSKRV